MQSTDMTGTQSDPVPEPQYLLNYTVTPLAETYDGAYSIYTLDGVLYYFSYVFDDEKNRYVPLLCSFAANGDLSEPIDLDEPDDITSREDRRGYRPEYAAVLSNGWNFFLYRNSSDCQIYFTDENGYTVAAAQFPDAIFSLNFVCPTVSQDGVASVLINAGGALYYFDETLALINKLDDIPSPGEECTDLGNGKFSIGYRVCDLTAIDPISGDCTSLSLHLPAGYNSHRVHTGVSGEVYINDGNGLVRYSDSGTPQICLAWSECPLEINANTDRIWMIDDNTAIVACEREDAGRRPTYLYIIETETVPIPTDRQEVRIDILSSHTDPVLNRNVYRFNQTNPDYRVTLYYHAYESTDDAQEILQDLLLYDRGTDLFMTPMESMISPYYDKNAFLNLGSYFEDQLLGIVKSAYRRREGLYALPTSMQLYTLVGAATNGDREALTWEQLYDIMPELEGEQCIAVPQYTGFTWNEDRLNPIMTPHISDLPATLYHYSIDSFLDWDAKESHFDSAAFRDMILYLQSMSDWIDAGLGGLMFTNSSFQSFNGTIPSRLQSGNIRYAEVKISSLYAFPSFDRIFGDVPYTVCGYPSAEGGYTRLYTSSLFSILQNTDAQDGCLAFLSYLLSDELQAEQLDRLPVTLSALEKQLAQFTYQYYPTSELDKLRRAIPSELIVSYPGISAEYRDDWGQMEDTSVGYTVFTYTEEDKRRIKDFFMNETAAAEVDFTVREIVNEELSYWKNNARTLEETTKIIDSRVWIYLNE